MFVYFTLKVWLVLTAYQGLWSNVMWRIISMLWHTVACTLVQRTHDVSEKNLTPPSSPHPPRRRKQEVNRHVGIPFYCIMTTAFVFGSSLDTFWAKKTARGKWSSMKGTCLFPHPQNSPKCVETRTALNVRCAVRALLARNCAHLHLCPHHSQNIALATHRRHSHHRNAINSA